MEYFEKKITYLRGLCDGSGFDESSKEGKLFHSMLDILNDMAFMLETFMDDEEMEYLDPELDEEDGEAIFYYSYICPNCQHEFPEFELDEEENIPEEVECPCCGKMVALSGIEEDELSF